jgi:predicted AAA+ superfamily ATPase
LRYGTHRPTFFENIFYWRTAKGHEVDFIYEPKRGEVTAMEVKLRYNKQKMTSMDYFKKEYSSVRPFIITLGKLVEPPEGIGIFYPWEMYEKLSITPLLK